ncbi:BatA domain-containing protein [Marinoscillum pacificum]|uniref:BatA domain-containing protein n=1 Tax=Marinoscillum pacificum TaxID=392723 RepID=UPI00215796F8|nr:BatA domain-containing protein [Marinoscillum pacificum]
MNFGTPTYLYALAAIAIPIVIHLWSKNTKTKVPFGSLKFLKETETKTTKHLFPSELLLLAVRILLIGSLAVLFAAPFIKKQAESKTAHLVDPNLELETLSKLQKELNPEESFWLSPIKTPIESPVSFGNIDTWSALKNFSDYDSVVIYSTQSMTSFQGEMTTLTSKVNWIQLPTETKNKIIQQISKEGRNTAIRMISNSEALRFETEEIASGAPQVVKIHLHSDEKHENLSNYLLKSITAINQLNPVNFEVIEWNNDSQISAEDWLIWLSNEPVTFRKRLIHSDSSAALLDQQSELIYGINPDITIENILQRNLPLLLETALLKPLNDQLDIYDQRVTPEVYLKSGSHNSTATFANQSIINCALLLFLILLLTERLLSQILVKK